ncbi:hypothetical protein BZG36_03755 [Bifiguratus adelaidae]|uniref:HD domain-containing protein n=1 Tax=Bifiguratus adelaidae TaxID=1938954 RepID=A0A261XY37_9FUNG|nr:hypothetical protein BZG36_03755 [Bifiguratus adelaidae]
MSTPEHVNGWNAVPRDPSKLLPPNATKVHEAKHVPVAEIPIPDSPVAQAALAYVQQELNPQTLSHSMRAYMFGMAIAKTQYPEWRFSPECYYLTCLFHDLATTHKNLRATRLSFEFYGGMLAHHFIVDHAGSVDLAESVAEAVMRHQDFIPYGEITTIGQLIQLATTFDNMGANADLVHSQTIEEVVKQFPRNGWTGCFANVVKDEIKLKPWSHTTSMGPTHQTIIDGVEANPIMKKYD